MGIRASTVRTFALSLPEAEERETWDTATFRVRNKIFLMFDERERHAQEIDGDKSCCGDEKVRASF